MKITMSKCSKISAAIVLALCLSSCASHKWSTLSGNISAEQVMQEMFPTLYAKCKSGEIIIDMIEQRTDKNGGVIYRVKYKEKVSDDDVDSFLQQTIYDPLLNH